MTDYSMSFGSTQGMRRGQPLEIVESGGKVKINIPGRWTAISDQLMRDPLVSHAAKVLGCNLLRRAQNKGKAYATIDELRNEMIEPTWREDKDTGKRTLHYRRPSKRSVQRWITELFMAGWLTWRRTMKCNEYTMTYPATEAPDVTSVPSVAPPPPVTPLISPSVALPDAPPAPSHVIPVAHASIHDKDHASRPPNKSEEGGAIPPISVMSSDSRTPTEQFMLDVGISPTSARALRGLDLSAVKIDLEQRLRGTPPEKRNMILGAAVNAWKECPPRASLEQRIKANPFNFDDPEICAYYKARGYRLGSDVSEVGSADDEVLLPAFTPKPIHAPEPIVTEPAMAAPRAPASRPPQPPPGYVYMLVGGEWQLWERAEPEKRVGLRAVLRAAQRQGKRDLAAPS